METFGPIIAPTLDVIPATTMLALLNQFRIAPGTLQDAVKTSIFNELPIGKLKTAPLPDFSIARVGTNPIELGIYIAWRARSFIQNSSELVEGLVTLYYIYIIFSKGLAVQSTYITTKLTAVGGKDLADLFSDLDVENLLYIRTRLDMLISKALIDVEASAFALLEQVTSKLDNLPLMGMAQYIEGTGLTAIVNIAQALSSFNDFPWATTIKNLPVMAAEIEVLTDFVTASKNNSYFGFYSQGISRRIVHITYISTQLLIRAGGIKTLERYSGIGSKNNKIAIPARDSLDKTYNGIYRVSYQHSNKGRPRIKIHQQDGRQCCQFIRNVAKNFCANSYKC